MANILPSSIAHVKHLAAVDTAAELRFDGIDFTPLLVYNLSTVPAAALLLLAEQFDLMGPGGWDLAVTEENKRGLIRGAIELHRRKGTVWAVKESIRRVGFSDVSLVEHVSLGGVFYNGVYTYNGTQTYGGGFWADFRIKITVPDTVGLSSTDRAKISAMVEEYKNVRSRLVDITFVLLLEETVVTNEDLIIAQDPVGSPDYMTAGLYYNGVGLYNGAETHNKGNDRMVLKIYQSGTLISTETI